MVETPDADAQADASKPAVRRLIVHAEAARHLHRTLGNVRELRRQGGGGDQPGDARHRRSRNVLDLVDLVLVMTVNPGFGGQKYIATMEPKITEVRRMIEATRLRRRHRGRRRHRPEHGRRRGQRREPTCSSPAARCSAIPKASRTRCLT